MLPRNVIDQWAKERDLSKSTVDRWLREKVDSGELTKVGRGAYWFQRKVVR